MNSLESSLRGWFERVSAWNPPSWIVGLGVGLLGWQTGFGSPTIGLDASWWSGLYMAAESGLQYGTEIVFTYGPLGILRFPWLFYEGGTSLIPFLYAGALFVALCIALVAVLRRRVGIWPASLIALLVIVQVEWIEVSVVVAILAALLVIDRRPTDRSLLVFAVAAGVFAGAEALVKLSTGPVIVLVLLIGLIGARARPRDIAAYLVSLVVSALAFWLLAGQSLGNLPDFISNSLQIVTGYGDAMSLYGQSGWYVLIILAATTLCVAWAAWGRYPDRRARWAGIAIAALVLLAFYKQSVVRIDRPHIATFFAIATFLWVAVPPRRGLAPVSLGGLAALAVVAIYASGGVPAPGFNLIENVKGFVRESRMAVSPERQRDAIAERRAALQYSYGLAARLRAELDGRTVSVEPWETTAAWAFEMDWSPAPVFQNYSAYTAELDQLNAETIASPDGPERILRHSGEDPFRPQVGLDGRLLAWDPPAQAIATLCHFRAVDRYASWQVLGRVRDRCGPELPIGTTEARFGEVVPVPRPGPNEVILARVEGVEPSGLERLRSLLYRPAERRAEIESGSYRLIAATAADGLMLRAGALVREGRGRFAQVPQTATIAVSGGSGELRYEFFRMRVVSPEPGRP